MPKLKTALVKPSKTLTVSLEYVRVEGNNSLTETDLATLSMQLRKSKAASLWSSDVKAISHFIKEQSSAIGSFPAPCPVIYFGEDIDEINEALDAGVDAIMLNENELSKTSQILEKYPNVEIVWKITNPISATQIIESGYGCAFLLPSSNLDESSHLEKSLKEILDVLPKKSAKILPVTAMQENSGEIEAGRYFKKIGVNSILVQTAIVGDGEDVLYATHVIDGLTSKKSSEFQLTGLTGSANGHFGGVEAREAATWRRKETNA